MIVGTAEVLVHANTAGFRKELEAGSAPAFGGLRKDAELAGANAGAGVRSGMSRETGKLAGDMETAGAKGGAGLHKGMSGGLSKAAGLISATGLPLGGLTAGLEKSAGAAEHAGSKASGLAGTLDHFGGVALVGVAGAAAATAAVGIHLAESMQSADAAIAAASGTSVTSAGRIGDAFLSMGGKTEFTAQATATAFASVAGQLKATEGHALGVRESLAVMTATSDLATAKQIDLGAATKATAQIMQAFKIGAAGAAHVTDVLYTAATATGQGVDTLANQLSKVKSKLGETGGSVGDLAGLLVDMTNQGITGKAAMGALNSSMNTLQKTATGVAKDTMAQKSAFDQMNPSLKELAKQYEKGTLTSKDFTKQTATLSPQQAAVAKAFVSASGAIATAQVKYKDLGVSVFDASGKFVGMGSIIDQLHPKFAAMTQQQQLAAASTLFGAGAARQMTQVINAGPAAYDKATGSVNKMGSAHDAAAKQAGTLKVEMATLKAQASDLATKIGAVLIPIVTAMVGALIHATTFVTSHKAALIALAAVVVGVLGPAIAVFTVNKMAAFGQSFTAARGHIGEFANGVQTAVSKVIGLFTQQSTAAGEAATKIQGSNTKITESNTTAGESFAKTTAGAETANAGLVAPLAGQTEKVTLADGTIGTENTTAGLSFAKTTAGAVAADAELAGPLATEVSEVGSADTAIETANRTAGASFLSILGPLGLAVGGAQLLTQAFNKPVTAPKQGWHFSSQAGAVKYLEGQGVPAAAAQGLAGQMQHGGAIHAGIQIAPATAGVPLHPSAWAGMQTGFQTQAAGLSDSVGAISTKVTKAKTLMATAASGGTLTKSQLEAVWIQAGGNPADANVAASVALAESSGRVGAAGDVGLGGSGPTSFGLWQVHTPAHPQYNAAQLSSDPLYNARAAVAISNNGSNFAPWSTYNSGAYRQYLGQGASPGNVASGSVTGIAIAAALPALTPLQKKQAADANTGASELNKMLAAIHSGTLKRLSQDLTAGQAASLVKTEKALSSDHSAALSDLSKLLAAVHAKALGALVTAQTKATNVQIAQETRGTRRMIHGEQMSVTQTPFKTSIGLAPATADQKALVGVQIAAQRAALQAQVAEQRAALHIQTQATQAQASTQTRQQAAAMAKQSSDVKSGSNLLTKLVTAAHSGSLTMLQAALTAAHNAGLGRIERSLHGDHSKALNALSKELVAVHRQAMGALTKQLAAQAKVDAATQAANVALWDATVAANQQAAWVTALGQQDKITADNAKSQADQIIDSTKVFLDQQAATGLAGTALVAANAQTSFDQVTQGSNQAIDAAQTGVDQAAGAGVLAQAQAASVLAQAQAAATISQAQAQSVLDKANANNTAAASTPTPVAAPAPAGAGATFNITIQGHGMSASDLTAEIGWALKTGALPVSVAGQ